MMKKYLSIITLCATSLVHGNGFENLKRLQDQLPALIYQIGGNFGSAYSAPEIPCIAAKSGLSNRVALDGNPEAQYIYNALASVGFMGMNVPNTFGTPESISFEDNVNNFYHQFDAYQCRSGHTVFGIAAQEPASPLVKVVISAPGVVVSPAPMRSPAGGSLLSSIGEGGKKLKRVSSVEETKSEAVSTAVSAPKSLLERVQDYLSSLRGKAKKSKSDEADMMILTELEGELNSSSSAKSARYNELVKFFELLEIPATADGYAGKVAPKIGQLRMTFKPKESPSLPTSENTSVVSSEPQKTRRSSAEAKMLQGEQVNALLARVTQGNAPVNVSASSNNAEVKALEERLKVLKNRKEELDESDNSDDWDDDDTAEKKTAAKIAEEKEELNRINAEILEIAEALAKHPEGRLDDAIETSNNKIEIYQKIKNYLDGFTSKTTAQEKIYGQVFSKLRTMDGGVAARRASIVNSSPASLIPNVGGNGLGNRPVVPNIVAADHMTGGGPVVNPVVAAVDIDAQVNLQFDQEKMNIENEMNRLQTELDNFNQKERKEKGAAQQKAIGDLNTRLQAYINEGKISATKMQIKSDLTKFAKKK